MLRPWPLGARGRLFEETKHSATNVISVILLSSIPSEQDTTFERCLGLLRLFARAPRSRRPAATRLAGTRWHGAPARVPLHSGHYKSISHKAGHWFG